MRKITCIILIILISILLVSCKGNVSKVNITHADSDIYTSEEIDNALNTVLSYFKYNFYNCTLTELHYVGDDYMQEENRIDANTEDVRIIILTSEYFHNTYDKISGLGPEDTISDWTWKLHRDGEDKEWTVQDFGYN